MENLKLKISKLLVNNKYKLDVKKDDTAVYVVDIPKVSSILVKNLNFENHYKQWCKITKRNGGVLVGGSIYEFFEYLNNNILNEK